MENSRNKKSRWKSWLCATGALLSVATTFSGPAEAQYNPYYASSVPTGGALGGGTRPRVFVFTDMNTPNSDTTNEFDDQQSMIHMLLYADVLDIVGIVGDRNAILTATSAYRTDYSKLSSYSANYPTPDTLDSRVYWNYSAEARNRLKALADDSDPRPIYVLCWGWLDPFKNVLETYPSIKSRIRIISIGAYNSISNANAHSYFYNQKDLWWVQNDTGHLGMFEEASGTAYEWTRSGFVETHVKDHGAMGSYYYNNGYATWWGRGVREGDSPTFLYLLRGNPDDPTVMHWGGKYEKPPVADNTNGHGTSYTNPGSNFFIDARNWEGRKTGTDVNSFNQQIPRWNVYNIATYRLQWLGGLRDRLDRARVANPGTTPTPTPTPSPSTNLLSNPGFEAEQFSTQTPSGWSEWSGVGGASVGYTDGSNNYAGNYHYRISSTSAYNLHLSQVKTGLTNGLYTVRCRFKSSGNFKAAQLEVDQHGDNNSRQFGWMYGTSSYATLTITNVNVTNGQCRVGFWIDANANNWFDIDDVELVKQ